MTLEKDMRLREYKRVHADYQELALEYKIDTKQLARLTGIPIRTVASDIWKLRKEHGKIRSRHPKNFKIVKSKSREPKYRTDKLTKSEQDQIFLHEIRIHWAQKIKDKIEKRQGKI